MEQSVQEFFHDFRQELLADAEANNNFQRSAFVEAVADELVETGFVEGFEPCFFKDYRIDGYWFNDEGALDLFIADFDCRAELASLTRTDVDASCRRGERFIEACVRKNLYEGLEVTSPEYGLARQISDRKAFIRQVNFHLLSERMISDRIQTLDDSSAAGMATTFNIWDISRLQRQRSARGHKEPLDLDFRHMFGTGIACLPAHLGSESYRSFLIVMPGAILSSLYGKFGARLLEQNVRSFLQARGKVNQGIKATILNEPHMFFAYNNGITATAQDVEVEQGSDGGLQITRIRDLQIVNGGQTTASLFHTLRASKDKSILEDIFVQMKLSVIDSAESELVVPRISEYANTQNRVNAADFFSNHPFHIRMEGYSRRLWAPAQQGAQRETRWFYERARGQYADAQAKLSPPELRKFKAENPKPQMFSKTDLAKFENVWDDHPRWVNLGAQKNFARYAGRIGKEWSKTEAGFNEFYYRRAIARAIIFRATEKLVSEQPWYNGGYRANIVAYALASLNEVARRLGKCLDFMRVWKQQALTPSLSASIIFATQHVSGDLLNPPAGISNISEWCKKEQCWSRLLSTIDRLASSLPNEFFVDLISLDEQNSENKDAKATLKIDSGIEAQKRVVEIPAAKWQIMLQELSSRRLLSPKELSIIGVAVQIPTKIPTEKQSMVLIDILERARQEGILIPESYE